MVSPAPVTSRPAAPRWLVDAAIVFGTMAFAFVVTVGVAERAAGERAFDAFAYGAIAAASLLLVGRRRWPLAVLAGTVALDAAYVWRDYPGGPGPCVAATAALAGVAATRPLRPALLWAGGALAVAVAAALIGADEPLVSLKVLVPFVWVTIGVLAGMTARSQWLAAAESRERMRAAERTRAEEARRQLGEERLRIARELHDVLAHSLATIHVQASAGAHVVARRPEQAEQVLATIKQASQEALDDLRTTVGILRTGAEAADGVEPGDDPPAGPRRPQPSLTRVEELLDAPRRTGARVTIDVTGEPRRLPAPVDVAGYRIVQEALTNVVRHAEATEVRVAVAYEPDRVEVTVEDDGRGAGATNGTSVRGSGATGGDGTADGARRDGHGLAGMRERAALLGGTVETGARRGGGFRVHARLPLGAGA